nr:hypothetical protein [Tanacetum cinerariifolium]
MGLDAGSFLSTPAAQDPSTATKCSDPEPLSSKGTATEILTEDAATAEVNIQFFVGSPESGRSSFVPSMVIRRGNQTKNLKTLLEAEVDMKKSAEAKNVELAKELDSLHAQFSDLQVSIKQLSDQVLNLQVQFMGEEKIKAAFEEFKKYEDDKVEQWCAEMDARLDKLSVDFDEELYPHMLTAIAGHRWVIGHVVRLAVMKYTPCTKAFRPVLS